MHDRGDVKWAPFNSLINGNVIVKQIENEKMRVLKPTLSDEQVLMIETLIWESFINKIQLEFNIYKNGYFVKKTGTVSRIEKEKQKIILDNYSSLYFCEIVSVQIKEF